MPRVRAVAVAATLFLHVPACSPQDDRRNVPLLPLIREKRLLLKAFRDDRRKLIAGLRLGHRAFRRGHGRRGAAAMTVAEPP